MLSIIRDNLVKINFNFEKNSALIAVSGGVDSIVLLEILTLLNIAGIVVHVDHGLRTNSASDSDFVAREAEKRGHKFETERFDVFEIASQNKQSIEEAARTVRYSYFEKISRKYHADYIFLGHHENDQAETVLMNLIRGSGTSGLSGMKVFRDGMYLRPMLLFSKQVIREYAFSRCLKYREDDTNKDLRFLRNRIRNELLPFLESYNPKIKNALSRTAVLLSADDDFFEKKIKKILSIIIDYQGKQSLSLDVRRLLSYHIAIQRRVLRLALTKLGLSGGFLVIEELLRLLGAGNSKVHHINNRLRVQCWSGKLYFSLEHSTPKFFNISLTEKGKWDLGSGTLSVTRGNYSDFERLLPLARKEVAVFDAKELAESVIVRSIRSGDSFTPLGLHGHKKLSDFLIDEKYPAIFRHRVAVVESRGEIVWVVGMRTSEYCKVVNDTETVVIMEFL